MSDNNMNYYNSIRVEFMACLIDFDELYTACDEWSSKYFTLLFNDNALQELVQDDNFKIICAIHDRVKAIAPQLVLNFLLAEAHCGNHEFLIPLAYIERAGRPEFEFIELESIGCASDLHSKILAILKE